MIRHLYVHTPFCAKICPYCAFHVHQGGAEAQREFVAALREEWRRARDEFPLAPDTIYFGGGTPSILSAELFSELAEEIQVGRRTSSGGSDSVPTHYLPPSSSIRRPPGDGSEVLPPCSHERGCTEFTLEVNPATVTPKKAAAWRVAGVNRISLGAQSFDAEMLKLLGRQHAPADIAETCALLREHSFENINIDLMFALPRQTEAKWEETMRAALPALKKKLGIVDVEKSAAKATKNSIPKAPALRTPA